MVNSTVSGSSQRFSRLLLNPSYCIPSRLSDEAEQGKISRRITRTNDGCQQMCVHKPCAVSFVLAFLTDTTSASHNSVDDIDLTAVDSHKNVQKDNRLRGNALVLCGTFA